MRPAWSLLGRVDWAIVASIGMHHLVTTFWAAEIAVSDGPILL